MLTAFQLGTQHYKISQLSAPTGLEARGGAGPGRSPGGRLCPTHTAWQHCDEHVCERRWLSACCSALHREQEGRGCLSTCPSDCESLKLKTEGEREKNSWIKLGNNISDNMRRKAMGEVTINSEEKISEN